MWLTPAGEIRDTTDDALAQQPQDASVELPGGPQSEAACRSRNYERAPARSPARPMARSQPSER